MSRTTPNKSSSTVRLLNLANAASWLTHVESVSRDQKYRHLLLKEIRGQRPVILNEWKALIQSAHNDARQMLRSLADYNLDPLGAVGKSDPARGYPEMLDIRTLKGYFGEIFAGVVAENYSPFGITWVVPALPFRFHNVAFDELDRWHQSGKLPGKIPGRTGDDNLAFRVDASGKITGALVCEAKCTAKHDAGMIKEAHHKVSEALPKPVEIGRLIALLKDYNNGYSRKWIAALRQLLVHDVDPSGYERCDLVCYVCGRSPVQKNRKAWMPTEKPHKGYKGGRRLQAVEVHIQGVDAFVKKIYGKK